MLCTVSAAQVVICLHSYESSRLVKTRLTILSESMTVFNRWAIVRLVPLNSARIASCMSHHIELW